jgi:hypothetical protein
MWEQNENSSADPTGDTHAIRVISFRSRSDQQFNLKAYRQTNHK